jgi:hypothetical protein
MNRTPWTKDFVCTVHERPGDDPEEASCAAHLFRPAGDAPAEEGASSHEPYVAGASAPGPFSATTPAKKYKLRPIPSEVTAVAEGPDMAVSIDAGPSFYVARDMFFAFFELVEPEPLPETAGALAKAPPPEHDLATTAVDAPHDPEAAK